MSDEWCTIKGFNISRPFNHSLFAADLTFIYKLCHSRKSINRALISHKRGPKRGDPRRKKRRRREWEGESTPPRPPPEFFPPPEHAGILPDIRRTPEFCTILFQFRRN
ncbi:hypothetical protein MA16_Dca026528 [Dendrobium catenatum]|uniref:Uncharacterized protein n=1 Tax=Dendrobium catenatum TaxID=906689 RepID=A0A2I0W2M6_9ASPA|nr:hypothetical protein MA16_Dca026528 [Dendrobium catenatum]